MFEMLMLCATLLTCTGAFLMVMLYLGEQGLFRITVQVAAAPAPQVILRQSAGQVFSGAARGAT